MRDNKWVRLLVYVTGLVNQRLLLENEYLVAENRILRSRLPTRLCLSDPERSTLAEIGKRLGRKNLQQVASIALPDAILAWYRRLIAQKFDGSERRSYSGRPRSRPRSKPSSSKWPARTLAGGTTVSSARWPSSAITFPTRPSATSCDATAFRQPRSEARRPLGRNSSRLTWRCWPASSFSPSKCSPGGLGRLLRAVLRATGDLPDHSC